MQDFFQLHWSRKRSTITYHRSFQKPCRRFRFCSLPVFVDEIQTWFVLESSMKASLVLQKEISFLFCFGKFHESKKKFKEMTFVLSTSFSPSNLFSSFAVLINVFCLTFLIHLSNFDLSVVNGIVCANVRFPTGVFPFVKKSLLVRRKNCHTQLPSSCTSLVVIVVQTKLCPSQSRCTLVKFWSFSELLFGVAKLSQLIDPVWRVMWLDQVTEPRKSTSAAETSSASWNSQFGSNNST